MSSVSPVVISILCPTKGQPEAAAEMTHSLEETSGLADVEVLFYIAEDDRTASQYIHSLEPWAEQRVHLYIGPNLAATKSYNFLAGTAAGQLLQLAHDGLVYHTPGWQHILRSRVRGIEDGIHCSWFNDGDHGPNLCTAPIVSRTWYETLGYLTPGLDDFEGDVAWIADLGRKAKRLHFIDNVHVEHRRLFTNGELESQAIQRSRDEETLRRTDSLRQYQAGKLLEAMGQPRPEPFVKTPVPDWHVVQQATLSKQHQPLQAEGDSHANR